MSDIRKLSPCLVHSLHPIRNTTAAFTSYRFILVSRLPYFPAAAPGDPLTVIPLSPPFTPVSPHFALGYTYTGTLVFSHHTCDLDTAFAILRAATYLSLPQLYDDETQVHAAYEMLHGLYHAFPEFEEYERITGANWGTGWCHCPNDVANKYLDRSVVGHCWVCSSTDNSVCHNGHTPPCVEWDATT
ncbi:hypothetical protein BDN67DRAFT_971806 [Paxillus ammoniavirescens]|nr:hypothetical protein BDN67DRAFT_971806 [Paxillus ammoniavirescens]